MKKNLIYEIMICLSRSQLQLQFAKLSANVIKDSILKDKIESLYKATDDLYEYLEGKLKG